VPKKLAYPTELPDSMGRGIAQRWCLLCHSAMLITQQAKDRRMGEDAGADGEWGVAVTPEERDTLRAYLMPELRASLSFVGGARRSRRTPAAAPSRIHARDRPRLSSARRRQLGDRAPRLAPHRIRLAHARGQRFEARGSRRPDLPVRASARACISASAGSGGRPAAAASARSVARRASPQRPILPEQTA